MSSKPKKSTKKDPIKQKTNKKRKLSESELEENEDASATEDFEPKSENEDEDKDEKDKSASEDEKPLKADDEIGIEYGKFQRYNTDKPWKLKKIAHHLLPAISMIAEKTNLDEIREFPLAKIGMPHSVFVNAKHSDYIDACHRRTIALCSYMTRIKKTKTCYQTEKKNSKKVRKAEKKGIYNKSLVHFAERSELHPDKYFEQDYDFYYTGGNLSAKRSSSQIAHVAGVHMNTLVLSAINTSDNIPEVQELASLEFTSDIKSEMEIYELQFSTSDDDYIFMRQKHCISVQQLIDDEINTVRNFKSKDVPFISLSQDPVESNYLAITDLMHRIRLCDIEQGIPIRTIKMIPKEEVTPKNNWNMIKSLDTHVYVYATGKKVTIIDTRLPDSEWHSNVCGAIPETECYSFCSLARSKFDNLFYIGANHKAYCIDRRFMNRDIDRKKSTVCTWTHQTSSFPLMMSTTHHNNVEYLALQSPLSSDLRICELIQSTPEPESVNEFSTKKARLELQSNYDYKSPCLPYMPPSIEILYNEVRLSGKCLKPTSGMSDRVKACMTGLDFMHNGNDSQSYLLTASSNGDIFARSISHPDEIDSKPDISTAVDVMCKFEDNLIRRLPDRPLNITEVVDLKGIKLVFQCDQLSLDEKSDYNLPRRRKYMGRWQKSLRKLSQYKDALAADLMAPWEFEIDDEPEFNFGILNQTEKSEVKVAGWLEKTEEVVSSSMLPMTSIPIDQFDNSNNTSGLNDSVFAELFNDVSKVELDQTASSSKLNVDTSLVSLVDMDQTASTNKPKVKKKSRYVKGF